MKHRPRPYAIVQATAGMKYDNKKLSLWLDLLSEIKYISYYDFITGVPNTAIILSQVILNTVIIISQGVF